LRKIQTIQTISAFQAIQAIHAFQAVQSIQAIGAIQFIKASQVIQAYIASQERNFVLVKMGTIVLTELRRISFLGTIE
jgi:hypothetical protein